MIVRRINSEEVYDGSLAGFFYDGVCSCVSYVDLYKNVAVDY